jgi:hypothetical protein
MITYEARRVGEIADRLQMSVRFLSWMMGGSPNHDSISKWLRGELSLKHETADYLLRLCQCMETELKESGSPFTFRAANEQIAARWRILLLRRGRIAIRFKRDDTDRLFGKRRMSTAGLAGQTVKPEPVAV